MKIDELNQNTVISAIATSRNEKPESADVQGEAASRKQGANDKVELSTYMPVVPTSQKQQDPRGARLEELKSQIASGTYQVPGAAVAEKMLSKMAMATFH